MATRAALLELVPFLADRKDQVKQIALQNLLPYTAADDQRDVLLETDIVPYLVKLIAYPEPLIAKDACVALVNLSVDAVMADRMVKANAGLRIKEALLDPSQKPLAELYCMLLGNLTRNEDVCRGFLESLGGATRQEIFVEKLLDLFSADPDDERYAWLGAVFNNVTQLPACRAFFHTGTTAMLPRLFPFFGSSNPKRRAVLGVARNVAFDQDAHAWLTGESRLLEHLLLPVVGSDPFSDADKRDMPERLANAAEPGKEREKDVSFRKMIADAVLLLCATRVGRDGMRETDIYPVLRDWHREEESEEVQDTIDEIVSYLRNVEEEDEFEARKKERKVEVLEESVNES